jgi:hypothetical protein
LFLYCVDHRPDRVFLNDACVGIEIERVRGVEQTIEPKTTSDDKKEKKEKNDNDNENVKQSKDEKVHVDDNDYDNDNDNDKPPNNVTIPNAPAPPPLPKTTKTATTSQKIEKTKRMSIMVFFILIHATYLHFNLEAKIVLKPYSDHYGLIGKIKLIKPSD